LGKTCGEGGKQLTADLGPASAEEQRGKNSGDGKWGVGSVGFDDSFRGSKAFSWRVEVRLNKVDKEKKSAQGLSKGVNGTGNSSHSCRSNEDVRDGAEYDRGNGYVGANGGSSEKSVRCVTGCERRVSPALLKGGQGSLRLLYKLGKDDEYVLGWRAPAVKG